MSVTKVTGMMSTSTKGGDIPSASTLVIDTDGDYFDITGTTGITAMTVAAGRRFTLQFDGALTLTHGSSLYLPGAVNFTTEANDSLDFIATAADTVRCTGYALKDGGSVVAGGVAGVTSSANTTAITISADEEVNMPLQPCFNIQAAAQTDQTGDGTVHTANFTSEIFDIGGNFASKQFTAPITGKYLLCLTLQWVAGQFGTTDIASIYLTTSNRGYNINTEQANNIYTQHTESITQVTDMDAGDTAIVTWRITGGSKTADHAAGSNTVFSGCLLT